MHRSQPYSITVHWYTLHDWTQTQWTWKSLHCRERLSTQKLRFKPRVISWPWKTTEIARHLTGEPDGKHALVGVCSIWPALMWTMCSQLVLVFMSNYWQFPQVCVRCTQRGALPDTPTHTRTMFSISVTMLHAGRIKAQPACKWMLYQAS